VSRQDAVLLALEAHLLSRSLVRNQEPLFLPLLYQIIQIYSSLSLARARALSFCVRALSLDLSLFLARGRVRVCVYEFVHI
jgi:hypothetical protein